MEPIEQATAAPGEKRNVFRDDAGGLVIVDCTHCGAALRLTVEVAYEIPFKADDV